MDKILVALDGSEMSIKSLEKAGELASKFGSTIVLLHIVNNTIDNTYIALSEYKHIIDQAFEETGEEILEEGCELIRDRNIEVVKMLKHGNPGKIIVKVAEEEGIDLIVMGNRGLTPVSRFMLGSVSNKVLNHAKCSVLIVK